MVTSFVCSTSLLQVFHGAERVVVAEPAVFALVPVAAEHSPGVVSVVALEVAAPGVASVADVAKPRAAVDIAVALEVAEPEFVVLAAAPGVVSVVALEDSGPGVASVADVAKPRAAVDIAVALDF
jgi:hypothetical protein